MDAAEHCPDCPSPDSSDPPAARGEPIPLTQLARNQVGVVRKASLGTEDARLLAAMGLCCNARVRLCRVGQPCIVAVISGRGAECRIGLARPLAERIVVDVVNAD